MSLQDRPGATPGRFRHLRDSALTIGSEIPIPNWDEYYRNLNGVHDSPADLLVRFAPQLPPGRALDLACGAGRHAAYLDRLGWRVTAVDSSPAAIALTLRLAPAVDARVADLETGGFAIEPAAYDLICDFFYLQRDLFPAIRAGVRPGGLFLGAMHMAGNNPNFVIRTGELPAQFPGWDVMHYAELPPLDGHRRPTAQIAVRRPGRYG